MQDNFTELNDAFTNGVAELNAELQLFDVNLVSEKAEKTGYKKDGNTLTIYYDKKVSFFRQLFLAVKDKKEKIEKIENRVFDSLSLMVDNSRNAVMNVSAVKKLIRTMAVMGYNELQLYTEDTYEVAGEPYMGYLRGRYSQKELKEIDDYADIFGIELVPCIQTLAHLRSLYRWKTYYTDAFDCNDVLLTDSDRVYELIENMFKTISTTFRSKKINIGMDEAFMLGRGKYLDKNGYVPQSTIYVNHLIKVIKIAQKFGFSPFIWWDMLKKEYYDKKKNGELYQKRNDVGIMCWDYGNPFIPYKEQVNKGKILSQLEIAKQMNDNIRFCGGAAKWFGFTPCNSFSLEINKSALDDCEKAEIKNIVLTAWGDCGSETPIFSVLPNVFYYAERCYGNKDMNLIKKRFSEMFFDFDSFMVIDCIADLYGSKRDGIVNTASKYLLYNDTFLGCMDQSVKPEFKTQFQQHIKQLKSVKRKAGEYAFLFETQIKLAEALTVKFDLGIKTRNAYKKDDKEALISLCQNEYKTAISRIKKFYTVFCEQWMAVNKTHGIDVTDIRFGALLFRMEQNRKRLLAYAQGKLEKIDELDEEILDEFGCGDNIIMQNWGETVTANTLIEYMSYV